MTTLDHFITELIDRSQRRGLLRRQLTGIDLLLTVFLNFFTQRAAAHSIDTSGLHSELTAHGQKGEAWRHIRLHCGCQLIGWPFGHWISRLADQLDRKQANQGRHESYVELVCNQAGLRCGKILSHYFEKKLTLEQTRHELKLTLAERPSSA